MALRDELKAKVEAKQRHEESEAKKADKRREEWREKATARGRQFLTNHREALEKELRDAAEEGKHECQPRICFTEDHDYFIGMLEVLKKFAEETGVTMKEEHRYWSGGQDVEGYPLGPAVDSYWVVFSWA